MRVNRSMPRCSVIPELAYPDVGKAIEWLCRAYGFGLRLRIGDHRAQLNIGEGAVVLTQLSEGDFVGRAHSVMVRVEDVDRHHERAARNGAAIRQAPADYPYGERQYVSQDLAGHVWTFSQSIADVAPEEWGGVPGRLDDQNS